MRADRIGFAAAACFALAACQHGPQDPAAEAREVVARCTSDASCVRDRWHASGARSLGLRSEIAGRDANDLFVVETTREIAAPDTASPACEPLGPQPVYYRTVLTAKSAPASPVAIFRWPTLESALAGHRRVAAIGVEARGAPGELARRVDAAPDLAGASVWIRGVRERGCAPL